MCQRNEEVVFDFLSYIPVISEASSKDDLLAYIQILEARLEIDLMPDPAHVISTGMLTDGAVAHVPAPQIDRVMRLRSGMDAVSLRNAEIAALRGMLEEIGNS